MILIIAEKPSLAKNIASAIGSFKTENGYYRTDNYLITYAFGHLFTLYDIEDYLSKPNEKWTMDNIPCFPTKFLFKLKEKNNKKDDGIVKQFNTIKRLCNMDNVDIVCNAGDADREGEIIVRLCIKNALEKEKPVKRLWLKDQTEQTIRESLKCMKDDSYYNSLANEGFARTYIDWLYGVNLTRYATLKTGQLLRVGRVIVPIVKAIYDRDKAITNFKVEKYYGMTSKIETNNEFIELNSIKKFSKDEYDKVLRECDRYNEQVALIKSRKDKKEIIKPGKLFSLSKLQSVLGKKYKMSMDDSLNILQGLYEKGFVTYPRTNSEYLAVAEKEKMKKIIAIICKLGYPLEFHDYKTIFDDSKIESHSALTPTYKIPQKFELTEKEYLVYKTIFRRFVAVFCAVECEALKTELVISVGSLEEFALKGMIIKEEGWTKFDDFNRNEKVLPNLQIGDKVNILFKPKEKETTPPKHYTIETLNNYLKNPFKDERKQDDDDNEDYRAMFEGLELGTEATRTGIIENAIRSKYIELKKDTYCILPNGIYLIESLEQMNINMDKYKTSMLGQALKKVYHNEISVDDSIEIAKEEIKNVFNYEKEQIEKSVNTGFYGDIVGKCPKCGKDVIKGKYGYGCMGYKEGCTFKINSVICKRVISIENAKLLLLKGKTSKIQGFTSKNNKIFDAYLKLDNDKIVFCFDK